MYCNGSNENDNENDNDGGHIIVMADSSDINMDSSTVDGSTIESSTIGSSAPTSVQGESHEQSPSPTTVPLPSSPPHHQPPSGPIQLKRKVSSRLPVPKKPPIPAPAPVYVPPYSSLRLAPPKESLVSPGPKSASPRFPTVTKRHPRIGAPGFGGNGLSSPLESPSASASLRSPRGMENYARGHTSHTATSLAKRASVPSLTKKASNSTLSRKVSAAQLQSQVSTPPRKIPGTASATVAPPLARKPSNSSITLNKRASNSHLTRKTSTSHLPSPNAAFPSPTPMRRNVSSGLPSPMPPSVPKLPSCPTQPGLRQQPLKSSRPAANLRAKAPDPPRTETTDSPISRKVAINKVASQSLRDTIAKARAAHRARAESVAQSISGNSLSGSVSNDLDGFNFSTDDPFNQAILGEGGSKKVLKQRIKTARVEGRLNISNLQLKEIPKDVYKMYDTSAEDLEVADTGDGPKWYESVDLVRFVGADNEIEEIGNEMVEQFGGLSSIDMHNNLLITLPKKFGELIELTVLNLTNNKLDHSALEIIFQISSLVDLKLAKNGLVGELPSSISKLGNLEILELQENRLDSLPSSLGEISRLHVLNVSSNRLQEIPSQALGGCQLQELTASNNKLRGTLFSPNIERLHSLRLLDIRNNHISTLSEGIILLPTLQQLFATNNELSLLPSVEGWNELLVFTVDSNRLEILPEGLMNLHRLRALDFSANNIKSLDPHLGVMEGLEILKFDGNPLRERSLLNMGIMDLKRTLKARLAPPEIVIAEVEDSGDALGVPSDGEVLDREEMVHKKTLEIGRGGILDLASRNYEDVHMDLIESVVGSPNSVVLLHNKLTTIPISMETFCASLTTLNIGHNKLSGDAYIPTKISLRSLTTLILQANTITSLGPLLDNLDAPKLETLDVSANRLVSIAGIRPTFPHLVTLYARDNRIEEIPVDSVDGMRVLDFSRNSIGHLPPKLGTVLSLKELRVGGNLFRVPRWQVLEKGTEGVMEWLRGKLPVDAE